MSDLKKVRELKIVRLEYEPYCEYRIEEFSGVDQYKTIDNTYHSSSEEANKHVEQLLAERLRYNKVKKSNVLSNLEISKLFPKQKFLEMTPAQIKVVDGVKKTEYLLYCDDDYYEQSCGKFADLSDVQAYIEDKHDARWNLDLITEVVEVIEENS